MALTASCVREPVESLSAKQELTIHLSASNRTSVETRADASDATIDPQSIYILVFAGDSDESTLLTWAKARQKQGDDYTALLKKQSEACYAYIFANAAPEIEALASGWSPTTTLKSIRESLQTASLPQISGVTTTMPSRHPMCGKYALPDGIAGSTVIGTPTAPIELTRATVKVVVAYAGGGDRFFLTGANLGSAPVKSFIFPDVQGTSGAETIPTAHYGYNGDLSQLLTWANPENRNETVPLYAYESPKTNNTFVIIKATYTNANGYYRLDLRMPDNKSEYLPLLRNYYYRITITRVYKPGYETVQEAINNPENGIETTIEIVDNESHEIISNGVDYLGLSNSEYQIYDSYALSEFNIEALYNREGNYEKLNGYVATTINYKSRTAGEITCIECTTESGGTSATGIRFRDTPSGIWDTATARDPTWANIGDKLVLPAATESVVRKEVIIAIPHDFKSGKIRIKVGTLEKVILITKNNIISFMGDTLDMGTGYSMAQIELERTFIPDKNLIHAGKPSISAGNTNDADFIRFSTTPTGSSSKTLTPNPSEHLYVKVAPVSPDPEMIYKNGQSFYNTASDFYITRATNQSRVKVHLIREPFRDNITDSHGLGYPSRNYGSAFWRNDQSGERIIRAYTDPGVYWTARVIYGEDFIRLAPVDGRTDAEIQAGNAEDYQVDATWKTYLQQPFYTDGPSPTFAFRIALTSTINPADKPRYGVVACMAPATPGAARGQGQVILVFVRQGEQPEYLFAPTEIYQGAARSYSQAFSPYNLTVSDPENHPGGSTFADHKSMNGRGVFTDYPTQQGYLYQWGRDIAIHPTNPDQNTLINGYTYDYSAPYQEVCPPGYMLAVTDESNSAYQHSLLPNTDKSTQREHDCLCADGFYDRQIPSRTNAQLVGTGHQTASPGSVYYNPKTRANIFFPKAIARIKDKDNSFLEAYFWGRLLVSPNVYKQGVVATKWSSNSSSIIAQDRKEAFAVRCVKERSLDGGGTVSPPGGGDYEPWE